jgi:hypothetical protein
MKNTAIIIYVTLDCYSDFTFYYTIHTNQEIINQIFELFNNTIECITPNISQIEIPKFKEPFDIYKKTFLDIGNTNINTSLDIMIEQANKPRTCFIIPKCNLYTIPFYIIGLYAEPIGTILNNALITNCNIEYLIPLIGTSFIAFSLFNNNKKKDIKNDINENSNEENTNNNETNNTPREFIRPSPYSNQETNIIPENIINKTSRSIKGFFYWDCFFDFKNGFVPHSALTAGIDIIENAPNWSARQLINAILDAVRHSQYYHLRSIRYAIHILNGNINDRSHDDLIMLKENIEELLQYYVNTKIHLDILENKYPNIFEKIKNFHYPVLYITEYDWNLLKKSTGNFNLLDVMKDILFIIVPNYDNVEDYLTSDIDTINNDNSDIVVSSNITYLIRNYEPNELLKTLHIFSNQNIENIIGLSTNELINLISNLQEEETNLETVNNSEIQNEIDNNIENNNNIPKKNIFKKLKEKIKKLFKKLKK